MEEAAATIVRADRVVTLDGPDVEALVVSGGRVLARGSGAGARDRFPDAEVVTLEGTVVPGLHDAHVHLAIASEDLLHLDLSPQAVSSHRDLLALLGREAQRCCQAVGCAAAATTT